MRPTDFFLLFFFSYRNGVFGQDRTASSGKSNRAWYASFLPVSTAALLRPLRSIRGVSHYEAEAGAVFVDKGANVLEVLTIAMLNDKRYQKDMYKRINGDAETFWIAWAMVGQAPFLMVPHGAAAVGKATGRGRICAFQNAHVDISGTRILWWNSGVSVSKYVDHSFAEFQEWSFDENDEQMGHWIYQGKPLYHWCLVGGGGGGVRRFTGGEMERIAMFKKYWETKS